MARMPNALTAFSQKEKSLVLGVYAGASTIFVDITKERITQGILWDLDLGGCAFVFLRNLNRLTLRFLRLRFHLFAQRVQALNLMGQFPLIAPDQREILVRIALCPCRVIIDYLKSSPFMFWPNHLRFPLPGQSSWTCRIARGGCPKPEASPAPGAEKASLVPGAELLRDLEKVAAIVNRVDRLLAGTTLELNCSQLENVQRQIDLIQYQLRRVDRRIRQEQAT